MSLLEDVFLEDEAGEAQELERVIEGDELDERPRTPDSNDDSEKEDEAEEDRRVVDHTAKAKRIVKNPRFVLNPARLMGPRGIQVIPEHFKDFKFKGKGHEREDLDCILKKLEHWAYRLYPKFKFDDCLKKIETLGRKRPVMVHLHKIRTDQYLSEETVQQQDSSGDEGAPAAAGQEEDEFDRLLQQQIELARSTPAPNSAKKELHTPMSNQRSPLMLPKVSSSPSISDEQKERMMRNRRLAEERRLARLKQANNSTENVNTSTEAISNTTVELNRDRPVFNDKQRTEDNNLSEITDNGVGVTNDVDKDVPVVRKHNRTNVIDSDSSDDENNVMTVNESVTVDVHNSVIKDVNSSTEVIPERAIELNTDGAPEKVIDIENVAEDATVINDDVIENVCVVKKHNRTNVIDSDSSDGENVLTVNGSVTLDVQKPVLRDVDTVKHNSDKENTLEEMDMESDKNIATDVPIDNHELSKNQESDNNISEIPPPNNETRQNTHSEISKDSNVNEYKTITNKTSSDIDTQKEDTIKDSGSVSEELMDVDFSDDF